MMIMINKSKKGREKKAFTLLWWAAVSGCWCCWTFSNLAIMMAIMMMVMIDCSEISVCSRIRIFTFSNILRNTWPFLLPQSLIIALSILKQTTSGGIWGWMVAACSNQGMDRIRVVSRRPRGCCVW